MGCSGRYAEAWEFAAFWCLGRLVSGVHEGATSADTLIDSTVDFAGEGVLPKKRMVAYNVTDGSQGVITCVGDDGCSIQAKLTGGAQNKWTKGDTYRVVAIEGKEIAQIEHYLAVTAGPIHAAVQAQGACDCLQAWAVELLKYINIVNVATLYLCDCVTSKFEKEDRDRYMRMAREQLDLIRSGKVDLCGGTGQDIPFGGAIEIAHTDFAAREIVANRLARGSY